MNENLIGELRSCADESSKPKPSVPRHQVYAMEYTYSDTESIASAETTAELAAIRQAGPNVKCWNCEETDEWKPEQDRHTYPIGRPNALLCSMPVWARSATPLQLSSNTMAAQQQRSSISTAVLAVLATVSLMSDRSAGILQHASYKMDSLDRDCLFRMVDGLCVRGDANGSAEAIAGTIIEACNVSMTTVRRGGNHHRPVVWWNADIAKARRECHAARRRCQRARSSPMYDLYASQFKRKRKELKEAIKAIKARHFQELCDAADLEPFGAAYKLVMKKLCRQPMPTCPRQLGQIVHALFPRQPHVEYPVSLHLRNNTIVLTYIDELKPWLERRHGQVDFYLTQLLTGHGCFKAYLFRFKHSLDPYCELCGEGVLEDAEHAVFHCPLFARERKIAVGDNARLTPDNIVATMLSSVSGWTAISNMASIIMKELRRRERSRREAI
ncbi:hypothetical protein ACLKA6_003665 [Drosophila palustris]